MRILRAYILREHAAPFIATLGTLTVVLLIVHIFKFAELIAKGVSAFDILRLLIYLIPYLLSFTIPIACLIAMVLAFGRLTTDYELIAMRASGVAPSRLVWPLLVTGLVVSTMLVVVNDRVVPSAHLKFRRQLKTIGVKQPTAYLEAGTFIKEFPPYTLFIYEVQGRELLDVRIYEPQPDGPTRTIIAERGEFITAADRLGVQLTLYDGAVDQWDPEHPGSFIKVSFARYAMTLRAEREAPGHLRKKLKEMTFEELIEEREQLRREGVDPMPVALELHRKIASSFSVMVFVLFGLALGLGLQHHERLMSFVWVLGIFLAYYLGTVAMNALALKGWLAAWASMWLPNAVGAVIGGLLVFRAVRR